jgi:nitroreductase
VLGTTIAKAARALQPLLLALLALAVVLFGLGSLPRMAFSESRANYLLARHRVEIVGLGAASLVAVVIVFLVG